MSYDSPFKIVFWVLVILMTVAAGGIAWLTTYGLLGIDVPAAALAPAIILALLPTNPSFGTLTHVGDQLPSLSLMARNLGFDGCEIMQWQRDRPC